MKWLLLKRLVLKQLVLKRVVLNRGVLAFGFLVFFNQLALASVWQSSVEKVTVAMIQPGYADLVSAFESLDEASEKFCTETSQVTYIQTQQAWRQAMAAWMKVSWIHFGPISSGTARFDIQIWPIRKGITHKTAQSLLAKSDLTVEMVDQAGVSIRGLTGAEYLLFSGSGGQLNHYQDQTKNNRCLLLTQASNNALVSVRALSASWSQSDPLQPFQQGVDLLDDTQPYNSAASILWNALLAELEFIQLRKLDGPLNIYGKKSKPTKAESWRSLNSFQNISDQLKHLKAIYQLGFEEKIQSVNASLNGTVIKDFDQLIERVNAFEQPMKFMLKNESGREQVKQVRALLVSHYQRLKVEVTPITGFVLGFNSNDGD